MKTFPSRIFSSSRTPSVRRYGVPQFGGCLTNNIKCIPEHGRPRNKMRTGSSDPHTTRGMVPRGWTWRWLHRGTAVAVNKEWSVVDPTKKKPKMKGGVTQGFGKSRNRFELGDVRYVFLLQKIMGFADGLRFSRLWCQQPPLTWTWCELSDFHRHGLQMLVFYDDTPFHPI